MDINIKITAFEELQGEDDKYKEKIKCEIEEDIDDEELLKITFGYNKPYFINKKELVRAINIMNY